MNLGSLYSSDGKCAAAAGPDAPLPPEAAFIAEDLVPRHILLRAARRAREQGVGADEVLIAEGLIEETAYYRALAARLNCPFIDRVTHLARGFDYRAALRASVARADPAAEAFDWLMAPRGKQVADLLRLADAPRSRRRIGICAPRSRMKSK